MPKHRTAEEIRFEMTAVLVLDRLKDVVSAAVNVAGEKYEDTKEDVAFVNGALFGMGATYLRLHADDVPHHAMRVLYNELCRAFEEVAERGMDFESYAQELLGEAEAEEASHV